MKKKKSLIALLLLGGALCAGAFALGGCSDDGSTNIPEEEPPLGPAVCTHLNVSHTNAKAPECTENGNKEYWFCDDCDKYFSDEGLTTETTLAAVTLNSNGHSYGKWIDEEAKSCNKDGVKGHYHCEPCGKNFDRDKKELTSLVIEKGHDYGTLIEEEPAGTCTDGKKAHYHCDACGTDFDDQKQEFDGLPEGIGTGSLIIKAQHNLVLVPVKEATCEEDGVLTEHRHCQDCGKNFATGGLNEIDVITEEHGHKYPEEYTYDYTEKVYKKVCERDNAHVLTQAAGTEAYPYLANDIVSLYALLNKFGGYIALEADISYDGNILVDCVKPAVLDLKGHTVTGTTQVVFFVGQKNTPVITIKNGSIAATANNGMAVYSTVKSNVTLENVNITKSVYGIYASCGTFNINGGEINASAAAMQAYSAKYYADPNAKPVKNEDYDLVVNISDATIKSTGIGINLRSALSKVENTVFDTTSTCVIVYRDTNITMTGCEMTSKNNCGVQGNGTGLITDMSSKSYYNSGINTVIALNNCTVSGVIGIYHPQIDGKLTVNGGSISGSNTAVEVRAGEAELKNTTLISTADSFAAEANGNGSTTQGIALAVSQHTTNDNIVVTVDGCELKGIYAIFEKDLMDETQPKDIIINIVENEKNKFTGLIYSENCENIADTADDSGNALENQAA